MQAEEGQSVSARERAQQIVIQWREANEWPGLVWSAQNLSDEPRWLAAWADLESRIAAISAAPVDAEAREFFCYWLARVYAAGRRDTSYEEGETLDEALRQINQVLGFAGYESESSERTELLKKKFSWTL